MKRKKQFLISIRVTIVLNLSFLLLVMNLG